MEVNTAKRHFHIIYSTQYQKLPKYVLHQLSTHDATTKEHIKLAEKHKCNFNDMLYMKWLIDEGNKMNFKVFDKQYGVSLKEILTTPTNF